MNIKKILSEYIYNAMIKANIPPYYNVILRKCKNIKFGHYQVNGIISAAINMKLNPYDLAKKVNNNIIATYIIKKTNISVIGHINIFINKIWLSEQLDKILSSKRLGLTKQIKSQNIVVDYSSPNIAKDMHIGHLRSTVLGDSVVKILSFIGHNVIQQNHIGDWGTQFGMLIAFLKDKHLKQLSITNLNEFYKQAQIKYKNDVIFAQQSRKYVMQLHKQDSYCLKIWKHIVYITMENNYQLYKNLNISLNHTHTMGESQYNHMLPHIVLDLKNKDLAIHSQGAIIVPIYNDKNQNIDNIIIQKSDGAYLYATTDIACIKYRVKMLHADRIIYYVDTRQKQYLQNIFYIAKKAKYINKNVILEHHMFGMVLNKLHKPFKTREGQNIKLLDLINEAIKRSKKIILKKQPNIKYDKLQHLAHIIGIGAIKYADLSKNRTSNYIFNWEEALNLEGNTSLYIQYAYVRTISILEKSHMEQQKIQKSKIILTNLNEINLAIHLLEFEEIILKIAQNGTPHILCNWLYKIAVLFSVIYETCNILHQQNNTIKKSKLKITLITSQCIKQGLKLLGIQTMKNM
ncbi:arginine--tRNA ligase [Enterobacteriaceae endosymbiont of Macroplea mutica]|uniref:arginine--tRNA ligase n=1 Tax=Enterobacteriaceae endosymbiont of Macroplea mutica TaxID=2675791 RepID=UPI001449A8C8|nr:arginine--tRNA ligase [Enterobacteriaceae endosymbiont of Macroplea mutica]QJC31421.1 arginine--tRNA ligase [Enterobacteriaceae endosymbiont of Macroplea mutica]